jgi:hypothetical protein
MTHYLDNIATVRIHQDMQEGNTVHHVLKKRIGCIAAREKRT